MVDFKKLADQAKSAVEKRGGVDALKKDAEQLKGIATGKGSLSDKAKAAAEALKRPGAEDRDPAARTEAAATAPAPPEPDPDSRPGAGREGGARRQHRGQGKPRRRQGNGNKDDGTAA